MKRKTEAKNQGLRQRNRSPIPPPPQTATAHQAEAEVEGLLVETVAEEGGEAPQDRPVGVQVEGAVGDRLLGDVRREGMRRQAETRAGSAGGVRLAGAGAEVEGEGGGVAMAAAVVLEDEEAVAVVGGEVEVEVEGEDGGRRK